jgi:hypothetical protein
VPLQVFHGSQWADLLESVQPPGQAATAKLPKPDARQPASFNDLDLGQQLLPQGLVTPAEYEIVLSD